MILFLKTPTIFQHIASIKMSRCHTYTRQVSIKVKDAMAEQQLLEFFTRVYNTTITKFYSHSLSLGRYLPTRVLRPHLALKYD